MLHEILLALAGHPSPLFKNLPTEYPSSSPTSPAPAAGPSLPHVLSSPERALLAQLSHLSALHIYLRTATTATTTNHPSSIHRAIAARITTTHLRAFHHSILATEHATATGDASLVVAAYGIVPLSRLTSRFAPWKPRLEWLARVVGYMNNSNSSNSSNDGDDRENHGSRGCRVIDFLRREMSMGCAEVREMGAGLVEAGERAWVRQCSLWLFYGRLPMREFGRGDFFIQQRRDKGDDDEKGEFYIQPDLLPEFVSSSTAESMLYIGTSLNTLRKRSPSSLPADHSHYARRLASLPTPISSLSLATVVAEMRAELSATAILHLLPPRKIVKYLRILHEFFLLGRGEFAIALVTAADEAVRAEYCREDAGNERVGVKEGNATSMLQRVWAELRAMDVNSDDDEDDGDGVLDLASQLVHFTFAAPPPTPTPSPRPSNGETAVFADLLLGTPMYLTLSVPEPLDLFLSRADIATYSGLHSYLLSIRRAQIHLSSLWRHATLRRTHPAPWGPPWSNQASMEASVQRARQRENGRAKVMRSVWATAGRVVFVVSAVEEYLYGEVVMGSWRDFMGWIVGFSDGENNDGDSYGRDPESIIYAHNTYLEALVAASFFHDTAFTTTLHGLLLAIDGFVALIRRLASIQQSIDLDDVTQSDHGDGDGDGDSDSAVAVAEEAQILADLRTGIRLDLEGRVARVIARLRDIDESRSFYSQQRSATTTNEFTKKRHGGAVDTALQLQREMKDDAYTGYRGAGVDTLLLKLDVGLNGLAGNGYGDGM